MGIPTRHRLRPFGVAVATLTLVAASGCAGDSGDPRPDETAVASAHRPAEHPARVVLISVDGLNPTAITKLGRAGTPNLHRLLREGSGTLNARTLVERTITLPNHTGMLTGRRVDARHGGHGVTVNHDPGTTVHRYAGERVASIFDVVDDAGRSTALYASKEKFAFFKRSWPTSIDRYVWRTSNAKLIRKVRAGLTSSPAALTFVHLSAPDVAGHAHGFLTPRYLDAVKHVDRLLGTLIRTVRGDAGLRTSTAIVVTADHGGPRNDKLHSVRTLRANYRVPVLAWGPGIEPGNLYALNPAFKNPGTGRPGYGGKQPIRNGMVANLALSLLGLGPVPGSTLDKAQRLRVG
ncbi:alkaline phosphatase family protein [Nocardioides dubius]|uniref:Type I phosphodiesterase / nucleotide pyrophosphatase n=1 Tax=Nocardioides dubius TaxID=317019 RepID=A0ABN1TYQ8_9ACTN